MRGNQRISLGGVHTPSYSLYLDFANSGAPGSSPPPMASGAWQQCPAISGLGKVCALAPNPEGQHLLSVLKVDVINRNLCPQD